ncbi:MAG: RNA 2',3'-cyclic phosphodiesterase [Candidatus Aminicenantales bacterium]
MRSFIAIDLEPEIKRTLQDLIQKLKKTGADVRWVSLQGMHLTLKFLGEVGADSMPAVEAVLKLAASGHPGFPLALHGTGAFPGSQNPRVLWAGITEEPELMGLQEDIDLGLEMEGYPKEQRAFHPHLTLGRVRSPSGIRAAVLELEKYREVSFGEMTVRKVALFESILQPQGAEYRVAAEFDLR